MSMQAFHEDVDRKAFYAFFLNSGGRANNDVLLYKHGNSVKFAAFLLKSQVFASHNRPDKLFETVQIPIQGGYLLRSRLRVLGDILTGV